MSRLIIVLLCLLSFSTLRAEQIQVGDRVTAKTKVTLRLSSKPVETVGQEAVLKVEATKGDWLWVKSPSGKKGWVRDADVDLAPEDIAPDAPPELIDAELSDLAGHTFFIDGATAVDLEHGRGAARMLVLRTYRKDSTEQGPFGPGWFDANMIQLTQDPQSGISISRSGEVLLTVPEKNGKFQTPSGTEIEKTKQGWQAKTADQTQITFDTSGRMTFMRSPFGRTITCTYDTQGRLLQVKRGDKSFLRYTYDEKNDRVSRIDGPEQIRCRYEYDTRGFLGAVVNSRGVRVAYEYDDEGNLTKVTDQFGRSTNVPAEGDQDVVEAPRENRFGPQPPPPTYKRNDLGQVVERRYRGATTKYAYDSKGRLTTITAPAGKWQRTYDDFDRITRLVTPRQTLDFSYNHLDEMTRIESSDGRWVSFDYDKHGRLTDWRSSTGRFAGVDFGPADEVALIRRSPSWVAKLDYDQSAQLQHAKLLSGTEIDFDYDDQSRPINTKWSTGEHRTNKFDDDGNLVESSSNGFKTTFGYNADGQLTSFSDAVYGKRVIDYSAIARGQVSLNWGDLGTWTRQANAWGQPTLFRRPSGQTTRYDYDVKGLLSKLTSPSGRIWSYEHDTAGWLIGIRSPGQATTKILRTANGLVNQIERNGILYREYVYGTDNRLRLESTPLGVAAAYKFDKVGRIEEVVQPDGKVRYSHNKFGLVEKIAGSNFEITQEYHDDGTLARRVYGTAPLDLRLPQDDQGRPGGVNLNGVAVQYLYGKDGRLEHIVLSKDLLISIDRDQAGRPVSVYTNNLKLRLGLDELNRLTSVGAVVSNDKAIFLEQYEYNAAGNLVTLESLDAPTRDMQYDLDDRLVGVITDKSETEYAYSVDDDLDSITVDGKASRWRLSSTGQPVMRDEGIVYNWDEAGNLKAVESVEHDVQNKFDAAGRLLSRTLGELKWQFGYLPNGDRLWQDGPSGKIWYAYLSSGLAGFKDEDGVTWLIVNMPGTDWPLALCGSNGTSYLLVADRLGSIRRVVDPSGNVVASSDYGAYGQLENAEGFAPLNLYAGMICDEHGLYYARNRYYDPLLCRFISLDPLMGRRSIPGSHNVYSYGANNPFRYRDTFGAQPNGSFPLGGDLSTLTDDQIENLLSQDRPPSYEAWVEYKRLQEELKSRRLNSLLDALRPNETAADLFINEVTSNSTTTAPDESVKPNPRVTAPFDPFPLLVNVYVNRSIRNDRRSKRPLNPTQPTSPTKDNDPSRSPSPVPYNPAVKKSLKDFDGDVLYSRPFWSPGTTVGGDQDVLNQVRGVKQMADDVSPNDVMGYGDDSFDRLNDDTKRLKKRVDDIKDSVGAGDFQDALDLAKQVREKICGIVAKGYRAADAPRLRREADDLLAKARAKHRAADDTNRKLLGAQRQAKELRNEIDKVKRPLDDLQKLVDARKHLAPVRQQFDDQWDQVLRSIGNDQQRAFAQIDDALGANTIAKILEVQRLSDVVPDNANEILKSARDALKDADNVLKKIDGENDPAAKKKRDDTLAKHAEAGTHLFEAKKCRGRILGGPSTTPLTGNVTADFLRALSPHLVKLRPRHGKSLSPDCPVDPHGCPVDDKGIAKVDPKSDPKDDPPNDPGKDYTGSYKWTNGIYAGFFKSFSWKQNGADAATVTFNMDGRHAKTIKFPATVPATVKRAGDSYVMVGDPLGTACSTAVTKFEKSQGNPKVFTYKFKITFTPVSKTRMVVTLNAVSSDPLASGSFPGLATRK